MPVLQWAAVLLPLLPVPDAAEKFGAAVRPDDTSSAWTAPGGGGDERRPVVASWARAVTAPPKQWAARVCFCGDADTFRDEEGAAGQAPEAAAAAAAVVATVAGA